MGNEDDNGVDCTYEIRKAVALYDSNPEPDPWVDARITGMLENIGHDETVELAAV